MKTKTLGIVIVALVVVVAAVLVVMSRSSSSSSEAASSSSGAEVTVLAPGDFKVADYAGKPLVVNMFGSWCPPCNLEAPDLGTFAEQNPGAQVVGIACEDTEKDAVAFMQKYGLTYPMVLDDGSLVQEFAITAYPTTIFFDAQGKEVDRLVGAAGLDQFNASLAKAQ
jgi:cytochrome c biogenesis protein CcmG, thiol:disulfide interchange protein DsbE